LSYNAATLALLIEIYNYMTDTLNCFLAENERQALRMAQLATGNTDDSLDIVQDAMIKLVQKYSNRSSSEWGPLFHRIVQRQITDWYRKNSMKNRILTWFTGEDEHAGSYLDTVEDRSVRTPDKYIQSDEAIEVLQLALHQLPMRQRQVFLLRCWQGLDTKETAQAMGCSTGSVKTHYHRALKKLQSQLGDTWP
jgi:RNA polymerase sigma-70 factor (ECF subfamily)